MSLAGLTASINTIVINEKGQANVDWLTGVTLEARIFSKAGDGRGRY